MSEAITMDPGDDDNTAVFVRLLAQHEPQIRAGILVLVPNWHDAQDLIQQVSVTLWRKFGDYERGRSFPGWAMGIARLEVKEYWRRKARERSVFGDAIDEFVDLVSDDMAALAEEIDHRRSLLKRCLDQLKPAHREVLRLRYLEGVAIDDIAVRVGRSVDAIYKSLARLRQDLFHCVNRQQVGQAGRR